MKPKALDLFCGAGGTSMSLHRVGFEVTGVDIEPQKRYPFKFVWGDALEFCAKYGREFDLIIGGPPCQAMGIDWMTQKELSQAIPPAYTEWLGKEMLKLI
jgi:site-specific DNA-cytosine methylase